MNVNLTDPRFHDENTAREWFELSRWPDGVSCVHCGCGRVSSIGSLFGIQHAPPMPSRFTQAVRVTGKRRRTSPCASPNDGEPARLLSIGRWMV